MEQQIIDSHQGVSYDQLRSHLKSSNAWRGNRKTKLCLKQLRDANTIFLYRGFFFPSDSFHCERCNCPDRPREEYRSTGYESSYSYYCIDCNAFLGWTM
jgi:hypothetical protein